MEHRLILGGEQFLPFARSCVAKLKKLGLPYADQSYEVDGVSIKVRIQPGHEYIRIDGGAQILSGFVANGWVEGAVLDGNGNKIGVDPPDRFIAGERDYYMQKFWPRIDLRPKSSSGWLTRGAQPKKLANLDLTFNGTSWREGLLPYPDSRASEYGKRAPASLYSGAMRKVVQVLLGMCKGVPRAERTGEFDRLEYGFNNSDIPYSYTFDKSHGVFTCSDHTKKKPNVWIIEISAQRGILAWQMATRPTSKTMHPDVHSTLGYMPVPTPRPVSTDADQRHIRQIWSGGGELSDYFGHEPFYDDCGWAFSYSGSKAANTSLEHVLSESRLVQESVWSHLWEVTFSEGATTLEDGTVVIGPASVSLTRHDRKRAVFGPTSDMKIPAVAEVGRTLLSKFIGAQREDVPTDPFSFPVYAFYGHDSEELRVIECVNKGSRPPTTIIYADDTSFGFGATSGNSVRSNIRLLRNGTEYVSVAGGFTGPGLPAMVNERTVNDARNNVTLGEYTGGISSMGAQQWAPIYKIRTLHSTHFEEYGRVQILIIPFGEREAVYLADIELNLVIDRERSSADVIGIAAGNALHSQPEDIFNTDGSYWGSRTTWTVGPEVYNLPGDGLGGNPAMIDMPLGGATYTVQAGDDFPRVSSPGTTIISVEPEVSTDTSTITMTLITSALSMNVPTYGSVYGHGPEPYNSEQFTIPGDTMGNHLIDCTSDAFTGAVSASEGIYRASNYGTFVSAGTGYYPAKEIDFRWGFWVGVPFYIKATP